MGFLLGISLTGATTYVYLLDTMEIENKNLLFSVQKLQSSVETIKHHFVKISDLQVQVKDWSEKMATKEELDKTRNELLKIIVIFKVYFVEKKNYYF